MYRAAVILLLVAECALAHPNHAGGSPLGAELLHLLSEPDHLAPILLFLIALGAIAALLRQRARRARPSRNRAPRGRGSFRP